MKKFLLATALTVACGVAAAQGYAGALIGMGKISTDTPDCAGITCDGSNAAFKIYGGYDISRNTSAELAYTSYGQVKLTGTSGSGTVKIHGISAGIAVRYELATDLMGVGRVGLSVLNAKANASGSGGTFNGSTTETKAYVGLGLDYAIASDFKLTGAVDITDGGDVYLFGIGAQMAY